MQVLMRIALRNLREHKSKSLIVGILIAMGLLILTLGNSILVTADKGIEESFINSFTGHVMIRTRTENPVTLEGSFRSGDAGTSLPGYSDLYAYVTSLPQVLAANPQITSFATVDFSEEGYTGGAFAPIFGIEPESYLNMFPDNMNLVEGRFLESGEEGIVLPKETVDGIRADLGKNIGIGDELKIQGFSGGGGGGGGLSIRRLPLVGVFEYTSDLGSTNPYGFVDASTVRSMVGMVVGSADVIDIDAADSSLLDSAGDLFSDDAFFGDDVLFGEDALFTTDDPSVGSGEEDLFGILGDTSERTLASVPDAGAWSYLLLRLKSDNQTASVINELNTYFAEVDWPLEAVDWFTASGTQSQFNRAIQIFFYVIIIILAVVSVIIIMNTLVISVIERTKEIGTMRSLGAHKRMVQQMFVAETMSISLIFGSIGLILGLLLVLIFNRVGLKAPNALLESVFGAEILRPVFNAGTVFIGYLVMVGIGLISSWYPVRVALRIQPLEALQSA